MDVPLSLATVFLAHASARGKPGLMCIAVPAGLVELEELLRRAWETGRGSWPHVAMPADLFVRHLAQRMTVDSEGLRLATLLEELDLASLYLAGACVHDTPAALETLEQHFLAKLPGALAHLKQPAVMVEEVCQMVRIHLLVGTAGAGPRLVEYSGRGSLQSWLRVIAVRMALRQAGSARETPEENVVAALEALPAPGLDAEFDLIKRRHHREFRQALREAFATLSTEQRNLLRLHFVERLPTTELGTLYRKNQSTLSRWLKSAREAVYEETKRRLKERLGLSSREFESLLGVIDSQFELSLSQLLTEEAPRGGAQGLLPEKPGHPPSNPPAEG